MIILLIILQLEPLEFETLIEESSYLSQLEDLINHPINPNRARIEDWIRIPFLSPISAYRLVSHRGNYRSLDDLAIAGVDEATRKMLSPFIRIGKPYKRRLLRSRVRYQVFNLDSLDDHRLYSRTITEVKGVKTYLTTERDPYEDSYLDYLGYGLVIERKRLKVAIGRYDIESGEGVVLGPEPFDFLRDYDFQSPRRGIIPYTQVAENKGFNGLAISYLGIYTFVSRFFLDGSVSNDTVRGIDYTGIHDDSVSLARKDLIREDVIGLGAQFSLSDNLIGIKGFRLQYDPPLRPDDSLPFYGKRLMPIGIDLRRYGDLGEVFGEIGIVNKKVGGIAGFVARLPSLSVTGAWSHYPQRFYSPHGGIVESGRNTVIANIELSKPRFRVGLRSYYQLKLSDQTSYYDLRPCLYSRFGRFQTEIELRQRLGSIPSYDRGSSFKTSYRFRYGNLQIRLLERIYPDKRPSTYLGVASTIRYKIFRLTGGIGSYSCPEGVIYLYEPDLPGRFNTVVFSGSGVQKYLILGFYPYAGVNLYFKYSERVVGLQVDLTL
ncbi:MAG TPA: helix-hairpin-helix domain-containing protein [bacterium (Candidatus Stahlbacteria)]|nr:helix-hairpin-helix domain-containing protein [Candidatus Stahlbacteria bacterium]